jgi:hypothetical protein
MLDHCYSEIASPSCDVVITTCLAVLINSAADTGFDIGLDFHGFHLLNQMMFRKSPSRKLIPISPPIRINQRTTTGFETRFDFHVFISVFSYAKKTTHF